ncbi:MAG: PAS domain S-box protein, partial [Holophagales bacterium]|nr:PAS domain S-box protein [Holophagales bacterium]
MQDAFDGHDRLFFGISATPDPLERWPELDAGQRYELRRRATQQVVRRIRTTFSGLPIATVIVGLASGLLVAFDPVYWAVLLAGGLLLSHRYRLRRGFEGAYSKDPRAWRRRFSFSMFATGTAWSFLVCYVLVLHGGDGPGFVTLLITAISGTQALLLLAELAQTARLYLLIVCVPPMVTLAREGSATTWWSAFGLALLLFYSWGATRSLSASRWRSLVESHLLALRADELAAIRARLQEHRDELEAEVEKRTADYLRVADVLRQREQDYRTIFENAHDAILILDPADERVFNVNRRACEIYGFERRELIGMRLTEISTAPREGRRQVVRTLEADGVLNFVTRQVRKDGELLVLDVNASAIEYQ